MGTYKIKVNIELVECKDRRKKAISSRTKMTALV
jgi:hypothetical protein